MQIIIVINFLVAGCLYQLKGGSAWDCCDDRVKDMLLSREWRSLSQALEDERSFDELMQRLEVNLLKDMMTSEQAWGYAKSKLNTFIAANGLPAMCWVRSPRDIEMVAKRLFPRDKNRQWASMIYMALGYMQGCMAGFDERSIFHSMNLPKDQSKRYGYEFIFHSGVIDDSVFSTAKELRFLLRDNGHFSFLDFVIALKKNIKLVGWSRVWSPTMMEHNFFRGLLEVKLKHDAWHADFHTCFFALMENFMENAQENITEGVEAIIRNRWRKKGPESVIAPFFLLHELPANIVQTSENVCLATDAAQDIVERLLWGEMQDRRPDEVLVRLVQNIKREEGDYTHGVGLLLAITGDFLQDLIGWLRNKPSTAEPISVVLEREWGRRRSDHKRVNQYLADLITTVYHYMRINDVDVEDIAFPSIVDVQADRVMIFALKKTSHFAFSQNITPKLLPTFFIPTKDCLKHMTACEKNYMLRAIHVTLQRMGSGFWYYPENIDLATKVIKSVSSAELADYVVAQRLADGSITKQAFLHSVQKSKRLFLLSASSALLHTSRLGHECGVAGGGVIHSNRRDCLVSLLLQDLEFRNKKGLCNQQEKDLLSGNVQMRQGFAGLIEDIVFTNIAFVLERISFLDHLVHWSCSRFIVELSTDTKSSRHSVYAQCLDIQKRKTFMQSFYLEGMDLARDMIQYTMHTLREDWCRSGVFVLIGAKSFWEQSNCDKLLAESNRLSCIMRLQDTLLRERSSDFKILNALGIPLNEAHDFLSRFYARVMENIFDVLM